MGRQLTLRCPIASLAQTFPLAVVGRIVAIRSEVLEEAGGRRFASLDRINHGVADLCIVAILAHHRFPVLLDIFLDAALRLDEREGRFAIAFRRHDVTMTHTHTCP